MANRKKHLLLVHPPVAKPSEPPAGIARLAGCLRANGIPFRLLDGNLEGLYHLLRSPPPVDDTWTRRSWKNRDANVAALGHFSTYTIFGKYVKAVKELNRLAGVAAGQGGAVVGLGDFDDPRFSPLRSSDLLSAAERYQENTFYPWFSERLPGFLDGIDIVGFSLNYLSQAVTTFAMAGFVRKIAPEAVIVLGGGLVTSWVRRPGWKSPFGGLVDRLVAGPGEADLLALCGVEPGQAVAGVPEYDLLLLDAYLSPGRVLPYSAAAGCYWSKCTFCPERAEKNEYLPVPASQASTEVRTLVASEKPSLIHFLDSAISPAFLKSLAEAPPGVPWYGFARIGGALLDPDFCRCLRKSGCVMLKLGLESGDQRVLDQLQKGVDLGAASLVLNNLKQAGIAVYLYLLFGTPPETEAEARRTLDFVVKHRDGIGFLNLAVFNMPVNSPEAASMSASPFYDGDLSLYTSFRHPLGWERRDVRRFIDAVFMRHPGVAGIVRADPPIFTSNHAPFFTEGYAADHGG